MFVLFQIEFYNPITLDVWHSLERDQLSQYLKSLGKLKFGGVKFNFLLRHRMEMKWLENQLIARWVMDIKLSSGSETTLYAYIHLNKNGFSWSFLPSFPSNYCYSLKTSLWFLHGIYSEWCAAMNSRNHSYDWVVRLSLKTITHE